MQGEKMKKITLISACMLLFTAVNAEQMQFVTTMSAPVGNFARLDAADPTHVTRVGKDGDSSSGYLNFCNTRSGVGDIIIKGAGAYLKQIDIQNGTTLGSTNTPEYRLGANLSIENGGTVTAGRVMANDVTFKDTNFHKSNVTNTIYGNDVAVMGGKTDNMEISGTAKINKSAQNSANLGEELWWDNQYAGDYDSSGNKKTNGKTYTSFLLKSKNGTNSTTKEDEGICTTWVKEGTPFYVVAPCQECATEGASASGNDGDSCDEVIAKQFNPDTSHINLISKKEKVCYDIYPTTFPTYMQGIPDRVSGIDLCWATGDWSSSFHDYNIEEINLAQDLPNNGHNGTPYVRNHLKVFASSYLSAEEKQNGTFWACYYDASDTTVFYKAVYVKQKWVCK